jgi:4-hydroxybenzoate polyprenyltransferase
MAKLFFNFKWFFFCLGIFLLVSGGGYFFYSLYSSSHIEGFVGIFRDLAQPPALIFSGSALLMIIVTSFSKARDKELDADINEDLVKMSKFGANLCVDVGAVIVLAVIGFWLFKYINPISFSILIFGIGLSVMGILTLRAHPGE